ncbi:MAG: Response regulator receiver protein [Candidatus Solibacter sp.]|nr:Response regulator receiver protein [Candidatus Solibacter sp.]
MAGEPILIVDDTPVNLKLTRILLVNEGYKVVTASSAEEALELLRSYHPRLILADIQLPGIDGLEMTRQIKRNERTRDTLVVALTAFAMKGDEERARAAGCDGYITKPIDTRSLGATIRELLDRYTASTAAVPATEPELLQAGEMQQLRRRFLSEGQEGARRLLLELDGPFLPAEAARAAHQWIGTGGLLGYAVIARLAREVETLLHERPVDTAQVRESLTNLVLAFVTPPEARDTPIPAAILESLAGKRVALVGLPAHETERLCVALEYVEAHAHFFELTSSPEAAELANTDLVVTYVHPQSANSAWLKAAATDGRPTVFVGSRDDLLALDPAVQTMASGILLDSWQPDEALVRLSLAVARKARLPFPGPNDGPIQVLVAAGDAGVGELVRTALQNYGVEFHHAADAQQALEQALRLKPHVAVLDIDIPGLDSARVLSAIRAEQPATRIILLTARQQEGDLLRGFTLGADDYVVKPFSPMELLARLKRLIAR